MFSPEAPLFSSLTCMAEENTHFSSSAIHDFYYFYSYTWIYTSLNNQSEMNTPKKQKTFYFHYSHLRPKTARGFKQNLIWSSFFKDQQLNFYTDFLESWKRGKVQFKNLFAEM